MFSFGFVKSCPDVHIEKKGLASLNKPTISSPWSFRDLGCRLAVTSTNPEHHRSNTGMIYVSCLSFHTMCALLHWSCWSKPTELVIRLLVQEVRLRVNGMKIEHIWLNCFICLQPYCLNAHMSTYVHPSCCCTDTVCVLCVICQSISDNWQFVALRNVALQENRII